ncbi:hypothetical protein HRbin17_00485 [bacterium HR17]|uniref:Glycoside hydrolase family 42 N-terminal domain-containing protein n=1 Tax=Candidatus Fervidibacter japonicus TaxID=2035412 RepID=A0A2H5X9X8_9BACT|nr:hypothetical protein HRbin17_00485 [bacterium HR17]
MLAQTPRANRNAPYAQWRFGPPNEPTFFPIAVWLQNPRNAPRYKAAGFNLYVGLWKGPTEEQLKLLREAGMPVICEQNEVGLRHRDDPIIVGWMHQDEPDNAQLIGQDPQTGQKIYGGPVPPREVIERYKRMKANDPDRPVLLNLGQGVANDLWRGRGIGAHPDDYFAYVKGCDIVSFDVYPVAGLNDEDLLWYVAKGVARLVFWVNWNRSTDGAKIVWNCVECTRISNLQRKPTPHHVRAEVWMALIHGSQGLVYFVHQFQPQFVEAALLEDPEMLAAVTQINRQIHDLAPVLNSPTIPDGAAVRSTNPEVPVHMMVKRYNGAIYLFAVGMRNAPTTAIFRVKDIAATATAEVLGENRRLPVVNGRFEDAFRPYEVHLYRLR